MRRRTDAALFRTVRVLAWGLRPLPDRLAHAVLRVLCALGVLLSWPFGSLRRRARRAGLRPLRWSRLLADNLASLIGVRVPLRIEDWPADLEGRPTVVLAAHLGVWEAGAAELARRGQRPLVLAAPWPRLPRCEMLVRTLRARSGIETHPRGRDGLRVATRALRDGRWIVVLVDSANPDRPRRRALPFGDGQIAAPDSLVRWAAQNGAALVVATAEDRTFTLRTVTAPQSPERLPPVTVQANADTVVRHLGAVVARAPSSWAWVRPLAAIALMLGTACAPAPLPPLPTEPDRWRADLEGIAWSGPLGDWEGSLTAERGRARLVDESLVGAFEDLTLTLSTDGRDRGTVAARSALGSLPAGPLTLRDVRWDVDGLTGELPTLVWTEQGTWSCDGCSLETIVARIQDAGK